MFDKLLEFLSPENTQFLLSVTLNILYAIIALIVGLWIIKLISKALKKNVSKIIKEEALVGFLVSTANFLLKVVLLLSIASMLGIQTASFIAVLGSIGLGVGLALQGSLANFAGGVLLLVFKPFTKGDFVTVKGTDGFVTQIDILYTSILTRLNRVVVIPNSAITSDVIINHSKEENVRRRFYLAISYNSDIKKAKQAFYEAVDETPHILKDPKPFVEVSDLKDNTIVFRMFIWCKPADYFRVKEPAIENIKYAWDKYGIEAPVPHRIVHMDSNT